ncbi:hypothetical protein JHK87_049812 [Glycine soja]|nr:hypothetical protein JHK87_049812 [Glycine soja]
MRQHVVFYQDHEEIDDFKRQSRSVSDRIVQFFVVARLLRSTCKWVTNESVRLLRAIIVSQA